MSVDNNGPVLPSSEVELEQTPPPSGTRGSQDMNEQRITTDATRGPHGQAPIYMPQPHVVYPDVSRSRSASTHAWVAPISNSSSALHGTVSSYPDQRERRAPSSRPSFARRFSATSTSRPSSSVQTRRSRIANDMSTDRLPSALTLPSISHMTNPDAVLHISQQYAHSKMTQNGQHSSTSVTRENPVQALRHSDVMQAPHQLNQHAHSQASFKEPSHRHGQLLQDRVVDSGHVGGHSRSVDGYPALQAPHYPDAVVSSGFREANTNIIKTVQHPQASSSGPSTSDDEFPVNWIPGEHDDFFEGPFGAADPGFETLTTSNAASMDGSMVAGPGPSTMSYRRGQGHSHREEPITPSPEVYLHGLAELYYRPQDA